MYKLKGTYSVTDQDGNVITSISDESIYKIIKQHSRLIDRLNPRKMLFMTIYTTCMISDEKLEEATHGNYRFFK